MITNPNAVALVCLFLWLSFEAAWDLRSRQIPVWFSLAMLIPGLIWLGFHVSPWVALLIAISITATEVVRRWPLYGSLTFLIPLTLVIGFFPSLHPLAGVWAVLIILWVTGVLGGADALAGLTLLLFFPFWAMAGAILAGLLAWSLALLVWKYRQDVGLRLWTVWKTRAHGGENLGLGAYALAALFYGVYLLIQ